MERAFHPEFLADLRRAGLTPETIQTAGSEGCHD
jgi:hypothetical protein